MATPSLVPDSLSGTSPSKVARSRSQFMAWMIRAKVVEIMNAPVEVTDHFNKLYELEQVPSTLLQGPLPSPNVDNEAEFQLAVHTWALTLRPAEGDKYGIIASLPTLALAYSRIRKTSNNHSNEHSQRRGIDDIIDLAFSAKFDRHCDFKTEESYRLVALNGNPDAQSDTLVTIPSTIVSDKIRVCQFSFPDPTIVEHLYWSTGGVSGSFSIIGFAGEFKKNDDDYNKNQLIMVLATAQAQRKALFLKDSMVMGAIACRGRLQVFSSFWTSEDTALRIYAHEQQFDLSDPVQVIRLYVFCSKLERHLQDTLTEELKTWNIPIDTALQNRKWRSPDHVRKCHWTEAGDSDNGSNGGRGGGNDGPVDATEFDDDQFMEVVKWRDKVVNHGKEGAIISGGGDILDMAWV